MMTCIVIKPINFTISLIILSNTTDYFTEIEVYMVIVLLRRGLYSNIIQSINLYNIGYSVLIRQLVLDDFITVKFGI
jgi:hypothetical protein